MFSNRHHHHHHFLSLTILLLFFFNNVIDVQADECQFLTMCKCTNFPLFALIDTNYLSKPRSALNQDLFCTYSSEQMNETKVTTFDQFKYFYYRFRTLTFAHYPMIPSQAFRYVHFESQSVKQTHKTNNRNVIAFVHIEQTQKGIFEELSLSDAHDQLLISFLDSPSMSYAHGTLAKLRCYELKFYRTNPQISIGFFYNTISIQHLIIDNPSFTGFLSSTESFTFQLDKLSIKDISIRHLQGKHFPIEWPTVTELVLENFHVNGGFRSWNNKEIAQRFPHLRSLKLYSRSIQHILGRMFEHFSQLEFLKLNGITTIENDGFFNLYHLKELHLGKDIRRLDPYAFLHMSTKLLLLNESSNFRLNDDEHFCVFVQFSPSTTTKSFVQFPLSMDPCSCTIRYLYRHLDKSLMFMTPYCYSNASLYILGQEERLCYFEQRLLQCSILPDEGLTIYGKHYNVSYFYDQQRSEHHQRWAFFYRYRIYFISFLPALIFGLCFIVFVVQQQKHQRGSTYRHLNRLLQRRPVTHDDSITVDMIYHRTNANDDPVSSSIPVSTKV